MGETNRVYVEKADFLLAQLAPGGLLEPAQQNEFIQLAIDQAVVIPLMTRVDMRAPKELREKIRYGDTVFRKGTEATALPLASRSRPETSKVELDAQLIKGETRLSFETMEDSIARDEFDQTVRDALTSRLSLDLEHLAFNGDDSGTDPLLQTLDGFRVQATTNISAAGGATLQRSVLKDALKTMPSEFRRDKRSLRIFTADEAAIDYHESIGDRPTTMGDTHVEGVDTRPFHGIPLLGVPVFPTDLGGSNNETELLLLDPSNMLFGVWREMRIDAERKATEGVYILVTSARVDFKYAHEPAVVKVTGLRAV